MNEFKKGKNLKIVINGQKSKKVQTDMDARWTNKGKKSYFGYKSHTDIEKEHGLIRNYKVADSSVYDWYVFEDIYIHGFDLPAYVGLSKNLCQI